MLAHKIYQQNRVAPLPRIEVILALYDGLIERIETARSLLAASPHESRQLRARCKVVLSGLAADVGADGGPNGQNFVRLFEFVLHRLDQGTPASLGDALDILRILRDGFQTVRPQALELERLGHIPPTDQITTVQALV